LNYNSIILKYLETKGLILLIKLLKANSVCTPNHAVEASEKYLELVKRMEQGENVKILVGTGYGMATCQGTAFEYIHNIAFDL